MLEPTDIEQLLVLVLVLHILHLHRRLQHQQELLEARLVRYTDDLARIPENLLQSHPTPFPSPSVSVSFSSPPSPTSTAVSEVGQSVPFGTLFEVHPSDGESERSASPIPIQLYPHSTTDDEDIAHFYLVLQQC